MRAYSAVLCLIVLVGCQLETNTPLQEPNPIPEIYFVAQHAGPSFPTEIVIANNQVWIAQLKAKTLVRTNGIPFTEELESILPESDIASPHFMASNEQGVYVSEGRGNTIRFFSFDGKIKGRELALDSELQRPHGLCIKEGWLYIADSVGSRLVRADLETGRTEVFADLEKKIAYGRQLLCRDDGIWLSNSYEKAFELNEGIGSNVLLIKDFASGLTETIVAFPDTNTTGLAILDDRLLLVGRWTLKRDLVALDLETGQLIGTLFTSDEELDAPYGIFVDDSQRRFYVAFLGINPHRSPGSEGAVLEWRY